MKAPAQKSSVSVTNNKSTDHKTDVNFQYGENHPGTSSDIGSKVVNNTSQREEGDTHEISLPLIDSTDSLSDAESGILAPKSLPDLSTLQNVEVEVMRDEISNFKAET